MSAAAAGSTGLPLWLVCTVAFAAMLMVALLALLGPIVKKQRADKQARLEEVFRYRVLSAYSGVDFEPAPEVDQQSALTKRALAMVDRAVQARGRRNGLVLELGGQEVAVLASATCGGPIAHRSEPGPAPRPTPVQGNVAVTG